MHGTIARAMLALLLIAGCGGSGGEDEAEAADQLTVQGVIETPLRDNILDRPPDGTERAPGDPCSTTEGYDDLREGTQVVIADSTGKTLALGALEPGVITLKVPAAGLRSGRCTFAFKVGDVPADENFYVVEVGRRGGQQYARDQLGEPLTLTIG